MGRCNKPIKNGNGLINCIISDWYYATEYALARNLFFLQFASGAYSQFSGIIFLKLKNILSALFKDVARG